ncbi:PREDICTED: olfactory receptor 1020-like [Gekko japonicus]|uniref:Olfactory receptor n=1 Tax=Gekko japonicus TaxID=146911 RepID=A0ABM1KWX7_GEKJA|nr:PREDICTED: olfactory receptor 1020-like [Gekko japonicus]
MAKKGTENQTVMQEFLLLGFGDQSETQIVLFLLFLTIYIVTLIGNLSIIALVITDRHLHTPMYFFLGNLSCLEFFYSSTILPRMLVTFFAGGKAISVNECIVQYYFFGFLLGTECYLLTAMSYDRYLAVCRPLHYGSLMNCRICLQLAAGSWFSGFLANNIVIYFISQLFFCGPNEIDHFFCDFTPMVKLSCSDTHMTEVVTSIMAAVFTLPPFLLPLLSYVCIVVTILRIPSTTGRRKAFSTCSSHLTVVTIFYGTVMAVYMLPKNNTLSALNKVFSVFYTVLTPLANPLIYSLRNKEVKGAMKKCAAR